MNFLARKRVAASFVGISAAAALTYVAIAPTHSSSATAVNAVATSAVAQASVPIAGACADQTQCNQAAAKERQANFPPAQPIDTTKARPSVADLVAAARQLAEVPMQQQASLPVKWKQTTMGQFDSEHSLGKDPLIDGSRPVWVITVHGPKTVTAPPGQPAKKADVYTAVVDAPTGALIVEATGLVAVR